MPMDISLDNSFNKLFIFSMILYGTFHRSASTITADLHFKINYCRNGGDV